MLLTINSSRLWSRLQHAARARGTTPGQVAEQLLEAYLPAEDAEAAPAAPDDRRALFHRWLEANRSLSLPQLPPAAFERSSFYDDERHVR